MKRFRMLSLIALLVIGIAVFVTMSSMKKNVSGDHSSSDANSVTVINISPSALQHITDRHTVGGVNNAGKSVFFNSENLTRLITDAGRYTPVQQANGNMQRVIDAGHNIGIDRVTGNPTSRYTVITDQSNSLITAFPGLP